jgi:hypothetical protein
MSELFIKQQAEFWLNATLQQFAKEATTLAQEGIEKYAPPVASHLGEILWDWQQGRDAYEAGDYAQALRMTQATQGAINDMPDMKARYPYKEPKEPGTLAANSWN